MEETTYTIEMDSMKDFSRVLGILRQLKADVRVRMVVEDPYTKTSEDLADSR